MRNYWRTLRRLLHVFSFTWKSMTYNAARPAHHYLDAAFEPLFWFVDKTTSYMGVIFVVLVTLLTSSVVMCWYMFLFPVIQTYSTPWLLFHYVLAHYLLVNIIFHYYQAVTTNPGLPPNCTPLERIQGAMVCKKCIQPKPPRAHHCSICNACYLKMDHHCPWMNSCIGFYNHRYFLLFCVFMWFGTIYVCLSSYNLFTYHFYHPGALLDAPKRAKLASFPFGFSSVLDGVLDKLRVNSSQFIDGLERIVKEYPAHPGGFTEVHAWEHVGIIYLFLLCSAVALALALLNSWHFMLLIKGETSIEVHVNKSERKKSAKCGMGYNNPYNYGWRKNIKILLGLYGEQTLINAIFPSAHKPEGDGISWPSNRKPVNYPDPAAYERYERTKNLNLLRKWCPC